MAQKLVLINGVVNGDALNHEPLKGIIEDGYEVASISGFVTQDNNPMCFVLLAEPTGTTDDNTGNDNDVDDNTGGEDTGVEDNASDGES